MFPASFSAISYPRRLVLAVLCGIGLLAFSAVAEETAPPLFQRVLVLGASFGAGFDSTNPFGGPKTGEYRFAHYLEAALMGAHEPVTTQASTMLFLKAAEAMEKQVNATVTARPSLVVALDGLFWFCYGSDRTPEKRLEFFETGLRFLERIDAPLVVGDIPDASQAVGRILGKEQMPPLSSLAQCNERLRTWAAARRNVTVFPLAEVMARAAKNEALGIGGLSWEAGKSRALLQGDGLHPARHGLAALAIAALDAAAKSTAPAANLCRDLEVVYLAGLERSKAQVTSAFK